MEKLLKIEAPKEAAGCQGSSGFWEEGRLREGISVCVGGACGVERATAWRVSKSSPSL